MHWRKRDKKLALSLTYEGYAYLWGYNWELSGSTVVSPADAFPIRLIDSAFRPAAGFRVCVHPRSL